MADNDAQLELKKRARRRLIGAIALVLAAAVFLPMVMDSEPHSGGNDLQIRIPSQEGSNYTSRLITTAPGASTPVAAQAQPQAPLVPPTDPEMAPTGTTSSSSVSVASSSASSAAASQAASSKSASSAAKSSVSAEARAKAALEGEVASSSSVTEPHFFVQLGAYRDPENVKSVQAQLKRAGMTATTDKVGDKTRVRVGPYKTRQAAESAAARLKQGGLNGVVTAK